MQQFIARAFFNLGWMRHFGTGLAQDFVLASKFYAKSEEANPGGVQVPIRIMQAFLYVHSYYNDLPMWSQLEQPTSSTFSFQYSHQTLKSAIFRCSRQTSVRNDS